VQGWGKTQGKRATRIPASLDRGGVVQTASTCPVRLREDTPSGGRGTLAGSCSWRGTSTLPERTTRALLGARAAVAGSSRGRLRFSPGPRRSGSCGGGLCNRLCPRGVGQSGRPPGLGPGHTQVQILPSRRRVNAAADHGGLGEGRNATRLPEASWQERPGSTFGSVTDTTSRLGCGEVSPGGERNARPLALGKWRPASVGGAR
jgi:hypothetical protein